MDPRKSRRRLAVLGTARLIAVITLAAACGGEVGQGSGPVDGPWSDVVAAAEREGAVTVYSSQVTDQLTALKAAFERQHPKIKLTYVRGAADEGLPKVEAEARTGRGIADLLVTAGVSWVTKNQPLFEAPRGPDFGAPAYNRAENVQGNSFVTGAVVLTYGWNTRLYPKGIKGWGDLLDPALTGGKIGVISPESAARVDFYQYLQENNGADFLTRLAAQRPRIYPSAQPMAAALTSGEVAVATFVEPLTDEKRSGAPVDWGLPKNFWGTRFFGNILKSAPHPNAAQVLGNFIVTREGQRADNRNAASALPDVPGTVGSTANVRKQDPSQLTQEKVRQFRSEWRRLFRG